MNDQDEARRYASGLRTITAALNGSGHETAGGVLGGEDGYGAEYANDVFVMHPYFWGDCTCGHEQLEQDWDAAHKHSEDCYQSELKRRGWGWEDGKQVNPNLSPEERNVIPVRLAAELGMSELGCAVHCTCSYNAEYAAWALEHEHDPACGPHRPNFLHRATGLRVDWYKYIGRGMESQNDVNRKRWAEIVEECIKSIRPAGTHEPQQKEETL